MKIFNKLLKIFGVIFFAYSVFATVYFNFNIGTICTFGISFLALIYGFNLFPFLYDKIILIPVIIGVCIFTFTSVFLFSYSHNNTVTYNEDALIVLGAGLIGDQVSKTLRLRLDSAIDYYEKNEDVIIIVSGGQGFDEKISEALAMQRYLLEHGIPEKNIIMEDKSTSTLENFTFSKNILDTYFSEEYSACFITNDFHIFRASRYAEKVGLNCTHYYAKTPLSTIPINYCREVLAVIKLILIG